jgi:hypothetical protein
MNVFVLCTGRCGSVTFSKACSHITNFTSGHESRRKEWGAARLAYPDNHIETDNRLAWLLGRLDATYGRDARYVLLTRNEDDVVESFVRKDADAAGIGQIVTAYHEAIIGALHATDVRVGTDVETVTARNGVVWVPPHIYVQMRREYGPGNKLLLPKEHPVNQAVREVHLPMVVRDMVRTIAANIVLFLKDKEWMDVRLEQGRGDFTEFWRWIGAEGDLSAALNEWGVRHNASMAA